MNLPADNLYKFMAFAGVALLAVTATLAMNSQRQRANLGAERAGAITHILAENRRLETDIRRIVENMHSLQKEFAYIGEGVEKKCATPTCESEWQKAVDDFNRYKTDGDVLRKEAATEEGRIAEYRLADRQLQSEFRTYLVGMVLGAVLLVLGSLLWYRRTQVIQDAESNRAPERKRRRS